MEKHFYKEKDNKMTLKQNNWFQILLILFFTGLGIHFYIEDEKFDSDIPLYIVTFIPILIFLSQIGKKVVFDSVNKTVESSIFGLMKKTYNYADFQKFVVIKHTVYYFIKEGISIAMEFKKNNKIEDVLLKKFRNTKKVESFLEQTEEIMK
jgi:hypothetical protein